jgi:hypothetical protein
MSLVMFRADVIATVCLMVCAKDEYLIEVSFLKYSGLLDYLVYCFPPVCIGWKSAAIGCTNPRSRY